MTLWSAIEPVLTDVHAPSQYIGGEWNSVRKDFDAAKVRVAVGFPDAYTIGMSHLGIQIFYGMLNAREDALCERFFAPWHDMEERMRQGGIPLFSIDSHRPVRDFDFVCFSLQTEMGYTNVVRMLELAGIPLFAGERGEDDPIVIGGGPNASHPEPIADFFDVLIHGDGEAALWQMTDLYREMRDSSRGTILKEFAARVPGCYVPTLYTWEFHEDGTVRRFSPETPIHKALIDSLADSYYPVKPIVPFTEVVFDRINLEIMRGCPHRCRFCQAVNLKNKLRFRPVDQLMAQAEATYASTGIDEIALISLSSGDYPKIQELLGRLNARFKQRRVSVSLPSLRIDEKLAELPKMLNNVRKSGFTVAPEGGTEELRRIIRKPIRDADLFETARAAFREGWGHLKLYFMIGLPGETEEDFRGILETAKKVSAIGKEVRGKWTDVNVTISPLVPKPHTPFQFVGQKPVEETLEIEERLRRMARGTRVHLKTHDPRTALVEAVLARGDRRLSKMLVTAKEMGCKFDEWREHFSYDRWRDVFEKAGVDPRFYAQREIPETEVLPWDHLDSGINKWYMHKELQHCREAAAERLARNAPVVESSKLVPSPGGERQG